MFKRKKKRTVTGKLMYPVEIGCKAIIDDGNNLIQTSVVQRIRGVSKSKVRFETENTHYVLYLKAEPVSLAS